MERKSNRPLLFWQKRNVGRVDDLEVIDLQLQESINDVHKVELNDVPTRSKKSCGVAFRPRCFTGQHILDCGLIFVDVEG